MKAFKLNPPLKDTDTGKVVWDERFQLIALLENPPGGSDKGLAIADVRLAIKAIDALEAVLMPENSQAEVRLEDAHHKLLSERINAARFIRADRKVLDLMERVLEARDPEAPQAEPEEGSSRRRPPSH